MPDLAQALTTASPMRWLIARVKTLTGDTVTITYRGGDVPNVGVLDQYVPAVGDVVHVLASDDNGFLAIGCNNQVSLPPPVTQPNPPSTVAATGTGTYQSTDGTWLPSVLLEAPTLVGCWFYPMPALAALTLSLPMASVAVRVTALDATPLEFVLHQNAAGVGPLVLTPGASYRVAAPPVGVATDVRLPLEWANLLILGLAYGVAVGGGDYTATFTGSSGLLTFTPL